MKNLLRLLLFLPFFVACSSDEPKNNDEFSNLREKLTSGYFTNSKGYTLRFFNDTLFLWSKKSHYEKYSASIFDYIATDASWKIENENTVSIDWNIYKCPDEESDWRRPDGAPSVMFNISFAKGKLSFTDQEGDIYVLDNKESSDFLRTEVIGHTFKAGVNYMENGINYRAVHTLTLKEDSTAEWSVEQSFLDTGKLKHTYSAVSYMNTNIAEDEVYFNWYYTNGDYPYSYIARAPERMTEMRQETNPEGKWLLYFDGGYDGWSNVNFVRQD